jgi:hypothetical protein
VIDYDFEERLIDRIALRESITAACLTPRQKQILRRHLYGQTFAEIAEDEGRSIERVRQIYKQSVRKIRYSVCVKNAGFDKAAFLKHMQGLVQERDRYEQEHLETERAELERMLAGELEPEPPPKPKPSPPPFPIRITLNVSAAPSNPGPPPISAGPVSGWLIARLLDAGEYYQVFNYYRWMLPDQGDG